MDSIVVHVLGFLAVPVTYVLMRVAEKLISAREFEQVRRWELLGVGFLVLAGIVGGSWHLILPETWLREQRLFDGTQLGLLGGIVVGYLAHSFAQYWWHRASHRFDCLWRLHQLHHAMPRIDVPGAIIFHPGETIASTTINVVISVFILGLDPLAVAIVNYITLVGAFLEHWNVNTPRWVILFAQRPETHLWHHERGVHAHNYSHFPLWDWLFGTYKPAPARGERVEVGFDVPVMDKIGAMMALVDINATNYDGAHTKGTRPANSAEQEGATDSSTTRVTS